MHSRVFNLSDTHYNDEEAFEMLSHVCTLADYTVERDDDGMNDDLDWLAKATDMTVEANELVITKEHAIAYWDNIFNEVRKVIDEEGINLDTKWSIANLLEAKDGFMVIYDGYVQTMDSFLRSVAKGYQDEGRYTVSQTFDYHF
jgi:hypothetical protein